MKVEITNQAKRDLKKLSQKIIDKIEEVLERLKEGKYNFRKLTAHGNEWKIRAGDYRIIIEINKESDSIFVRRILPRKDVYRRL
ncbi:MAG: type II toxin-antitoxin system RelE/ParE family toxin [Candidatus Eremiobacterota bacterium]